MVVNREAREETTESVAEIGADELCPLSEKEPLCKVDAQEYARQVFNPILFTRGVESDAFYLILSGKVVVCSGNEGFLITQSSFNYLGAESLVRDDYKPDFSAKVIDKARILKITRLQYRKAISSVEQSKSNFHTISVQNAQKSRQRAFLSTPGILNTQIFPIF